MRLAGAGEKGSLRRARIPDPKPWGKMPTFRIDERQVQVGKRGKARNSAILRVWHASCNVFGIPGMVPGKTENTETGDLKMTTTDFSNRFAAAAFSLVISAAMFAYAIVPATPSLA
jgi:hypothetical protein